MEQPVKVTILGREYLIKSDLDEKEVHNIADYVNNKFKEIMENTEGLSERKMAILAAFDIASEYFQLTKERDDFLMDIDRRVRALNLQIDSITR